MQQLRSIPVCPVGGPVVPPGGRGRAGTLMAGATVRESVTVAGRGGHGGGQDGEGRCPGRGHQPERYRVQTGRRPGTTSRPHPCATNTITVRDPPQPPRRRGSNPETAHLHGIALTLVAAHCCQDKRNSRNPFTCSFSVNPDRIHSHAAMKVIGKQGCGGFPATDGFVRELIAPRRIVQLHLRHASSFRQGCGLAPSSGTASRLRRASHRRRRPARPAATARTHPAGTASPGRQADRAQKHPRENGH